MVGHEGSSAGSYLADPTSPIPSHCQKCPHASIISGVHVINWCVNLNSQESTKLHQTPHSPNQPLIQPINQSITFHSHLTQSTNQQINQSFKHIPFTPYIPTKTCTIYQLINGQGNKVSNQPTKGINHKVNQPTKPINQPITFTSYIPTKKFNNTPIIHSPK